MIVTAMLSWFDDPPELLREAVRGAATLADRIVAADGAFKVYPGAKARSGPTQRRAIREEAQKQGLAVEFLPPQIWEGQVAKRDAVLQRAKQGSDWVVTVDSDWRISGDREQVRGALEELHAAGIEQVLVAFFQPGNEERPWQDSCADRWHEGETDQWRVMPFIYRVLPEMHYSINHWSLFGVTDDGRRVGMLGGVGYPGYEVARSTHLGVDHLFEHRCLFRSGEQVLRVRYYIAARDEENKRLGVEL